MAITDMVRMHHIVELSSMKYSEDLLDTLTKKYKEINNYTNMLNIYYLYLT